MLEATIIGNIGKDAEIKNINGKNYASFSVASSKRRKDQNGNKVEQTTWVGVLKPINENVNLVQHLTKGTKVFVRGDIKARAYQGNNGLEASMDIMCSFLEFVGGPVKQETTDDLPF